MRLLRCTGSIWPGTAGMLDDDDGDAKVMPRNATYDGLLLVFYSTLVGYLLSMLRTRYTKLFFSSGME